MFISAEAVEPRVVCQSLGDGGTSRDISHASVRYIQSLKLGAGRFQPMPIRGIEKDILRIPFAWSHFVDAGECREQLHLQCNSMLSLVWPDLGLGVCVWGIPTWSEITVSACSPGL